jgi:hypothetical protein
MSVYGKRQTVVAISYHAMKAVSDSLDTVDQRDSPMLSNKGEQALCRLFDSLIERFRWRVSVCAQDLILRLEHTL